MKFRNQRVVTAFLENRGRILVLQRSRRIGTYPGYWAGVSGTVEFPEDVQVYVEIYEETGLTADDLTLVQKGRPMTARDNSFGVNWVITPYLFRTSTRRVRLNSENIGYRWVRPRELESLRTPPRFVDGFRRVFPPYSGVPRGLDRKIFRGVRRLAHDRSHGAAELAHEASTLIGGIPGKHLACRQMAAVTLAAARPLMPGIGAAAHRAARAKARGYLETESAVGAGFRPANDRRRVPISLEAPSRAAIGFPPGLARAGAILTHSYSSTVLSALRYLRPSHVFATDSYPLGEGRRTQAMLHAEAIEVHRVADTDVDAALRKVDVVLVGADAVVPGQGIVNKVGTLAIARRARARGIPVFVVCGREKRTRGMRRKLDFSLALKALDPEGCFEFCPMRFVTRIGYV
ncbi:MAG: NUDIX domain-containing protein [Nitrospirae bacterium]|nr:NUDIX domain-containing protein [Nitrospirota bacterium]